MNADSIDAEQSAKMQELQSLLATLIDPKAPSSLRHTTIGRLGAMGEIAVLPLLELMQSSDDSLVRRGVPMALGRLGDPRVLNPLIQLLADADPEVREASCLGLSNQWC